MNLQNSITKKIKQTDKGLILTVKSQLKWRGAIILFIFMGTWLMAPMSFAMGRTPEEFLIFPGIFFAASFFLVLFIALWWQKKNSGRLLIDEKGLEKISGFDVLPWQGLKLPRKIILIEDSYKYKTQTIDMNTQMTSKSKTEIREKHRLMTLEIKDDSEIDARWEEIKAWEKKQAEKILDMNEKPQLPGNAVLIYEELSYSVGRVLADSLLQDRALEVFDFTYAEPERRNSEQLDYSYNRQLRELLKNEDFIKEQKKPLFSFCSEKENKLTFVIKNWGIAIVLIFIIFMAIAFLFFGFLLTLFIDEIPVYVPTSYGLWVLFILGLAEKVKLNAEGIRISLSFLGIPIQKGSFISWPELGNIQYTEEANGARMVFLSSKGAGHLAKVAVTGKDAFNWCMNKICKFLRRQSIV